MKNPIQTTVSRNKRTVNLRLTEKELRPEHFGEIGKYKAALKNDPENWGYWAELGELFAKKRNWGKAARCYDKVIANAALTAGIKSRAALVYVRAFQVDKGFDLINEAIAEEPNDPHTHLALFRMYRQIGQHQKACATLSKVKKAIAPRLLSESNLSSESYSRLSAGQYIKGLTFLKHSWDQGTEKTAMGWHQRKYKLSPWDGGDLTGRSILVTCEQGLGDAIVFLRYLPLLAKKNPSKISVVLAKPLHRLLEGHPNIDHVFTSKSAVYDSDVQVFTFDFPLFFKTTPKTVPAPATFSIPKSSVTRARKILKPYEDKFKVGVLWTGNPNFPENPQRSFPARHFTKLADIPNLQMFSLYKGEMPKILTRSPGSERVLDVSNSDKDLADSAAFMQELDLVITVDSAVAHLAGSVGANTWCLLKYLPFWYYANGKRTPWYPDMRLFKQDKPDDWDTVFKRVRRELTKLAAAHQN